MVILLCELAIKSEGTLFFSPFFSFICIQNSVPNNNLENEQNIRYIYILSNKQ